MAGRGSFRGLAVLALACASAVASAATYGPTGPRETLWSAAAAVNAQHHLGTQAQAALALYRANPQAFRGSPSKLKPGSVLTVPSAVDARSVSKKQAFAIIVGGAPVPKDLATLATPPPPAAPQEALTAAEAAQAPPAAPTPPATVAESAAAGTYAGSREQAEVAAMSRDGQRADEIYKFLLPLEERFAGDVDYDYALGVAALDSGRFSDAILILQRAVASRPGFAGARMDLARAYYVLGDNESARREFRALQDQQPPPEAARVITQYLQAIDRKAVAYQPSFEAYGELGAGYDSNANGGPDIQQFLGFTLDDRNQASDSSYYSAALGGTASYPFAPHWRVLALGQGAYRANPEVSFVDSQTLRAGGGLEWAPTPAVFSLVPSYTQVLLDGQDNHDVTAVDLAGSVAAYGAQFGANARFAQTRYVDALSLQDVDTTIFGLSTSAPLFDLPAQVGFAATQGYDEPSRAGSPFGRDVQGLRAFIAAQPGPHRIGLSVGTLTADYDKPFFGATRSDDQLGASLAYQWTALQAQGWLVGANVNYVQNSSSVPLYDYERMDAGLSLRREFK